MTQAAFDSLKAVEEFQEAGMPGGQAKAVARAIQRHNEDHVTNKDLNTAIAQLETRLTNRLYMALGMLFAALVAVRFLA